MATAPARQVDTLEAKMRRALGGAGYVPLEASEERELARRFAGGDSDAGWALAMANLNFVRTLAQRYLRDDIDAEDLVSEGLVGMLEAARRFDADRGIKFITYGAWWVKRAILRHLRTFEHPVHVPKYVEQELHELRRARHRLTSDLGRAPSLDELSSATGASSASLRCLAGLSAPHASLDAEPEAAATCLASPGPDPEAAAVASDALRRLDEAVGRLDARDRHVLRRRFGLDGADEVTLVEVGREVGLTKERIRQIEKSACRTLQRALTAPVPVTVPPRAPRAKAACRRRGRKAALAA